MSLFATFRQFTGQAWRFRAYVRDSVTGQVVAACDHKHRSRFTGPRGADGQRTGKNGGYYAQLCADKMLRTIDTQRSELARATK